MSWRLGRRLMAGSGLLVLLAAAPGATTIARAATVTLTNGNLSYTAATGEVNSLSFFDNSGVTRWTDSMSNIYPSLPADCTQQDNYPSIGQKQTTCIGGQFGGTADVSSITIDTGDLNDGVNLSLTHGYPAVTTTSLGPGDDFGGTGPSQDAMSGGTGADNLVMSQGGDTYAGGDGIDTLRLDSDAGGTVLPNTSGNGAPGWNATIDGTFENLYGGQGNDVLTAGAGPSDIHGEGGSDTVTTGAGDDTIDLEGGSVTSGAGNDTIYTASATTSVNAGTEGSQGDTVDYYGVAPAADGTGITIELGVTPTVQDVENLRGTGGRDVLKGDAQPNTIKGDDGEDQITGGPGQDKLYGEHQNDSIKSDDGAADLVDCGDGTDFAQSDALDTVNANCEASGVVITDGPSGLTGSADATFSFEMPGAPAGSLQCQLDGFGFSACTSPQSYHGLSDGNHTFEVRFVPDGGQPGPATSRSWQVDTTLPVLIVDSAPTGTGNATEATISFHSSEPDGATFRCSLDGAAAYDCVSPERLLGLIAGAHSFTMTTTDPVGHQSAPVTVSWTVGGSAPPPEGSGGGGGGSTQGGSGQTQTFAGDCPAGELKSVSFGVVAASAVTQAACFKLVNRVRTSAGPVLVNGILFQPQEGSKVIVDASLGNGIVKTTGRTTLFLGNISLGTWDSFEWSGGRTSAVSKVFSILGELQGKSYLNLPLTAVPSFELSSANGGQSKATLKLAIPGAILRELPGTGEQEDRGVTFEHTLTASNALGVQYGAKVKISEGWLFGRMRVKDVELAVDTSGPYFDGAASLLFGRVDYLGVVPLAADKEFRVGVQLGSNGLLGALRKFSFTASAINRQLGTSPFYLQRFGGEMGRVDSPLGLKLAATAGFSAGPMVDFSPLFKGVAIGLEGTVTFTLPQDPSVPWSLEVAGNGKIVEVPVAGLGIKYVDGVRTDISGNVDLTFGGYGFGGRIADGKAWVSGDGYSLSAQGSVRLPIGIESQGEAVISGGGWAACFGATNERKGFSHIWGAETEALGNSCDVGSFEIAAPTASSAANERSFTVKPGARVQVVELSGADTAPGISVTGPGGFSAETSAGEPYSISRADVQLIRDIEARKTYIVLTRPTAGTYTIASNDAIAQLRTALNLPPVEVKASVRTERARRLFSWRAAQIAGQSLEFVDRGPNGAARLIRTTKARGSFRFDTDPATGRGAHTIDAIVLQDGRPRSTLVVARYTFKPMPLRAVARVRLRGRRLTWRAQRGAAYAIALESRDGTRIALTARVPRIRVPRAIRSGAVTARIMAVDRGGRLGPATVRKLKLRR